MREWSDEWIYGPGAEPLVMRDRETGRRIPPLRVRDAEGRELGRRDIVAEAGPGASPKTRALFARGEKRSGDSSGSAG